MGFNKETYEEFVDITSRIDNLKLIIDRQKFGTTEPDYELLIKLEAAGKTQVQYISNEMDDDI